jgi:hypothetical protein
MCDGGGWEALKFYMHWQVLSACLARQENTPPVQVGTVRVVLAPLEMILALE